MERNGKNTSLQIYFESVADIKFLNAIEFVCEDTESYFFRLFSVKLRLDGMIKSRI